MKTLIKEHFPIRILTVCLLALCLLLPSCTAEPSSESLPEPGKTTQEETMPATTTSETELTESPSEPLPEPSKTTRQETPAVQTISAAALKKKIDDGNSIVLVDVRATDRYDTSHIDKAISIPYNDIPDRYDEIPQNGEIIVYTSCA